MISLHLITDNAPPERLDRAVAYLKRTKQPYVNIAGGSQIDRAMQLVERCQIEIPGIQVFWRILQDTGNVITMDDNTWWSERVAPRLVWMQAHKVIMVIDNETSGDDGVIKKYVAKSITRMNMLHSANLGGAFCRFATGNIGESQYVLLKPLLEALGAQDWISPNEYSNKPGKSSGGHLERYKRILAVTPKHLNVSIGECGILDDYKANAGYLGIPMSGRDMAAQLIADEMWYNGGTIPRFLFAIGGYAEWATLQVNDDALTFLEDYYAKNPIESPVVIPTPPAYTPPPFEVNRMYRITVPADYVNMHSTPSTLASKVGTVSNGAIIHVDEESLVSGEYWRKIDSDGTIGWISLQNGAVKFDPYVPPEQPPPADTIQIPLTVLDSLQKNLQASLDMISAIRNQQTK